MIPIFRCASSLPINWYQSPVLPEKARAMAGDEGKVKIDRFDGKDFGYWKIQIKDYLYQKKLHLLLLGVKPVEIS